MRVHAGVGGDVLDVVDGHRRIGRRLEPLAQRLHEVRHLADVVVQMGRTDEEQAQAALDRRLVGDRLNYLTWEEGKTPDLAVELTSSSTRHKDTTRKFQLYQDVLRGFWPGAAGTRSWRGRCFTGPPDHRGGQDAGHVGQPKFADPSTQFAVVAIGWVHQCHARRHAIRHRLAQLPQCDLGLGLEADVIRHSGDRPADRIVGPFFRQIQPVGNGQAALVSSHRQAHRHLAVVLLAQLTAILPRHPD
jgi:hypothetical protein